MEFYFELKKTMSYLKLNFNKLSEKVKTKTLFDVAEYENFKTNVSAYYDGELTGLAILRFKNYMDKVPSARDYCNETIYFNRQLNNCIKAIPPRLNKDFSRKVIANFKKQNSFLYVNGVRTVITIMLALSVIFGFFMLEKIVLKKEVISKNKNVSISKIKENIIKLSSKNFIY